MPPQGLQTPGDLHLCSMVTLWITDSIFHVICHILATEPEMLMCRCLNLCAVSPSNAVWCVSGHSGAEITDRWENSAGKARCSLAFPPSAFIQMSGGRHQRTAGPRCVTTIRDLFASRSSCMQQLCGDKRPFEFITVPI